MTAPFDTELMSRQIHWAHTYDAYERIAGGEPGPPALAQVLEPCWREWRRTQRIPAWCGVDLLRAWAFYLVRLDRHGGGYALGEGGDAIDEWNAVLSRLAEHPAARAGDVPPTSGAGRTTRTTPAAPQVRGAEVESSSAPTEASIAAFGALTSLAEWSEWLPFPAQVDEAPRLPGVYLLSVSDVIVYVGMAGERAGSDGMGRPKGLRARLRGYASGRAAISGFGQAVLDRALSDTSFVEAQLSSMLRGESQSVAAWSRAALATRDASFCWAVTQHKAAARALELQVESRLQAAGVVLWNKPRVRIGATPK